MWVRCVFLYVCVSFLGGFEMIVCPLAVGTFFLVGISLAAWAGMPG